MSVLADGEVEHHAVHVLAHPLPGLRFNFTSTTDTGLGAATVAVDHHTAARPSDTPDTEISQDRDVHRDLLSFDIHVHGHYFLWWRES